MRFFALLASALLLSSTAQAQTASRYDLACKPTKSYMIIGDKMIETKNKDSRLSLDLTQKLWCSRRPDTSCGTVSPLVITPTNIEFNESLSLDRRTGVLTMKSGSGNYQSMGEFSCVKAVFTPLPATKF